MFPILAKKWRKNGWKILEAMPQAYGPRLKREVKRPVAGTSDSGEGPLEVVSSFRCSSRGYDEKKNTSNCWPNFSGSNFLAQVSDSFFWALSDSLVQHLPESHPAWLEPAVPVRHPWPLAVEAGCKWRPMICCELELDSFLLACAEHCPPAMIFGAFDTWHPLTCMRERILGCFGQKLGTSVVGQLLFHRASTSRTSIRNALAAAWSGKIFTEEACPNRIF